MLMNGLRALIAIVSWSGAVYVSAAYVQFTLVYDADPATYNPRW